jgi:hypothetical protein
MEYDMPRRYASHNDLSYSSYYFGGRNDPLALSHSARVDPRGYHMGGPVGGARGQLGMERDEPTYDHGGLSRRRIAVAVSSHYSSTSSRRLFHGYYETLLHSLSVDHTSATSLTPHTVRTVSQEEDQMQRRRWQRFSMYRLQVSWR